VETSGGLLGRLLYPREVTRLSRLDRENRVEFAPEVLERDGRGQLDELFLAELGAQPSEERVSHLPAGIGHPFRELQGQPLSLVVRAALPPLVHFREPCRGHPAARRTGRVAVDSEGATVDECGTERGKPPELGIE